MATNSKENRSATTRDSLLRAAERIVARDGVARLTLDMVAQEAGISKGGILYHFPTKNALIAAMMESDIAHWKAAVYACRDAEVAEGSRPNVGRMVRAFLSATEGACEHKAKACREVLGEPMDLPAWLAAAPEQRAGMIVAVAGDQNLLQRFREEFASWQTQMVSDGLDPATATAIRLAADGLFFADMLGLAPPSGELRTAVLNRLLDWATPKENNQT